MAVGKPVQLQDSERAELRRIVDDSNTNPAYRYRANILLLADAGYSRTEIDQQLPCSYITILRTLDRFFIGGWQAAVYIRTTPQPATKRLPVPAKVWPLNMDDLGQDSLAAQIVALASSPPPDEAKFWSISTLARQMRERGLVDYISTTRVKHILQQAAPQLLDLIPQRSALRSPTPHLAQPRISPPAEIVPTKRDLPAALLQRVVAMLDDAQTHAIALDGSYARGEASEFSDVDLVCYRDDMSEDEDLRHRFEYHDSLLFSIHSINMAAERDSLNKLPGAIWFVAGLLNYKILLDKRGEMAAVQAAAQNFQWAPLQAAANDYASEELAWRAETALKLMAGLSTHNLNKLHRNADFLARSEANIIAVQRGLMLYKETDLYDQVAATLGENSDWVCHYRRATGLDFVPSRLPLLEAQAIAALRLHLVTSELLRPIIRPQEQAVIETVAQQVKAFLANINA